jgi:hypothetical protein
MPPAVGPQVVIPPMPAPLSGLTASPSGQAMPVGNLPGWRQVFADDFLTQAPVGAFDTVYRDRWESYPDGWANTAGYEAKARRYSSRVVSVANGMLNINLHSENLATSQLARNGGSGGPGMYALTAALQPKVGGAVYNQTYGKYTIRFRVDPGLDGYYAAWLLWPQSESWPRDGEIDFPEGGLTGEMCAFMHHQGGTRAGDQDKFCSGVAFPTGWHTASTEWEPDRVTFILDGQVVGVSTSRIPNTPMRYVLQTEACWGSCPAATMSGNIQVDWMVIYARG